MSNENLELAKKRLVAEALVELVQSAKSGGPKIPIGLMATGNELGIDEFILGAQNAMEQDPHLKVIAFGPKPSDKNIDTIEWFETEDNEEAVSSALTKALKDNIIQGAVALHYPFPVGVSTIGRILTPAKGRPMLIASCTGTTSSNRPTAMLLNAIYGIALAKALGIKSPTLGVLNLDAAPTVQRALSRLKENGYSLQFGSSVRADGGALLRGNDLLAGELDVCVTDSLTGNVLLKLFAAYTSGGAYESMGWGYGPSVGENWDHIISIISRASGAPVIANALQLTAISARAELPLYVKQELAAARKAGLKEILDSFVKPVAVASENLVKPTKEPTDAAINGIDVLDLDVATQELWKANIYAEAAMGCTGPVIKLANKNLEKAKEILSKANYI